MMNDTMIDIPTKYGVVSVCPPFSTQKYTCKLPKIYRNMENVFNKGNFMMFCCHGNAINLKL